MTGAQSTSEQRPAIKDQFAFGDFTRDQFVSLIRLARRTYTFRTYRTFQRNERFILWRHDVDFSMHSARQLAILEEAEGVAATYFVNPHSEFYNLLEREISDCLVDILSRGHALGLHLDVHYHGIVSTEELGPVIEREARLLEETFGRPIEAFSFHNTTPSTMEYRNWTYGGLINTYAEYFQQDVGYCSDSNGHWRFRRLADVLEQANDERLQVLTHDGWWQATAMSPRARVFRCVLGRAEKTLARYDDLLKQWSRANISPLGHAITELAERDAREAALVEYLYFSGRGATAVAELWRLHAHQLRALAEAYYMRVEGVSEAELTVFLEGQSISPDRLFEEAFGVTWSEAAALTADDCERWGGIGRQIISGAALAEESLDRDIELVLTGVGRLARWGDSSPVRYDGLGPWPPTPASTQLAGDAPGWRRLTARR